LSAAGWDGSEIFTPEALKKVYQVTQGVPRKINRMCDRLLLYAYLEGHRQVRPEMVDTVEAELREEHLGDEVSGTESQTGEAGQASAPAASNTVIAELPARRAGEHNTVVIERERLYSLVDAVRSLQSELTTCRTKLNRIYDLLGRRY
jgi:hypothetical protein